MEKYTFYRRKSRMVFYGAAFLLCACFLLFYFMDDKIHHVSVGNIDLNGLTRKRAADILYSYERTAINEPVILRYKDKAWLLTPASYGFSLDVEGTVRKAWQAGRKNSLWPPRLGNYFKKEKNAKIDLELKTDNKKFIPCLRILEQEINRPVEPARITGVYKGKPVVAGGVAGTTLDVSKFKQQIARAILEYPPRSVDMPVIEQRPKLTREEIENRKFKIIGTFTTKFDPELKERTNNIMLASRAVDGTVLLPGEEFSYNQVVGPRVGKRGYKEANVMVNGALVPGIGGGVCQVSTTIYSAALYARLKITERKNHTRMIDYVPPGQDATVEYAHYDLKFRNTLPGPVIINCKVSNGQVTVDIWGEDFYPGEEVALDVVINKVIPCDTLIETDPTLAPGEQVVKQQGVDGYDVSLYRVFKKGGREIKREFIEKTHYVPFPEILKIGPPLAEKAGSLDGSPPEEM